MQDDRIIALFWARNEQAIRETSEKYGKLCFSIALNVLHDSKDSEECVNDTWLGAWNAIPEARPKNFSAFLARIVRNLALKRYEYRSAQKRNFSGAAVCLDELAECVSGRASAEDEWESRRIETLLNRFLAELPEQKRNVFLLRYWFFESVEEIGKRTGFSGSKIKSMLFHMRRKLRAFLESEGVEL